MKTRCSLFTLFIQSDDAVELELSSDEEPELLFGSEDSQPSPDDGRPSLEESQPNSESVISLSEKEDSEEHHSRPLLHLYLFFLFMFQTLFRISDTALDLLLKFTAMLFRTLHHKITTLPKSFSDMFPTNIASA